jgi:ABC-type antimicrobial peptide transport system permease subunit
MAALLTLLGTYVLAETMTVARRREMGIRAALGASRRRLRLLVLQQTVVLVGLGVGLGLGLTVVGADAIRAFLFRVQPLDPVTLVAVAVAMVALACTVSLRPAIRASRVDFASLLRED